MEITSEIIISWEPCTPYTPERVRELVPHPMSPQEILALPIPVADRLWVVLRDEVLPEKILRQFAADCAQSVVHLYSDPRYQNVIDIAIGHAVGVVPDEVLTDADECARKASEAAAAAWEGAARAAASASRAAAAWVAAAARDAACDAAAWSAVAAAELPWAVAARWAASEAARVAAAARDVTAAATARNAVIEMQVKQLLSIINNQEQ